MFNRNLRAHCLGEIKPDLVFITRGVCVVIRISAILGCLPTVGKGICCVQSDASLGSKMLRL